MNQYSITQVLDVSRDLPYGMNREYIGIVKPSGLLRTWFQSPTGTAGPDINHLLTIKMKLEDSGSSLNIGADNIPIAEGDHVAANVEWEGTEVAFAFSKSTSAESTLTQTGDSIRY